jgi:hypothetical protein
MLIATISKLPSDLMDVRHILPGWLVYLDVIARGLALLAAAALASHLVIKFLRHRRELDAARQKLRLKIRSMSREELRTALAAILKDAERDKDFRAGLHRMSALIRAYFEISLKKEIEEMTAREILAEVSERQDLGTYFAELSMIQYKEESPDRSEFVEIYNKAVDLMKRT